MYTPSIVVNTVIDALKAFVTPFVIGGKTVRGQGNRVPMPSNPCCVLTELIQVDLSRPGVSYQPDDDTASVVGPTRIDVQIDLYGVDAGNFCKAIVAMFRSGLAYSLFPDNVKPLYTSDGNQSPLVTGEEQYETRWTITASMQYNPVIVVPQEFAEELSVDSVVAADLLP